MSRFFALTLFAGLSLAVVSPAAADAVDVDALMAPGPLKEMTLGDPDAPVTIVEYASMTCPHCQRFHTDTYPTFKSKYIDTGQVYFVFREFPLDPLAFAAIMLARCAPEENFFPIVEALFEQQPAWAFVEDPEPVLTGILAPMGIGSAAFSACLADEEVFNGITAVADRGQMEFGVQGTPTFFVNGERYVGTLSVEQVDQILEAIPQQPG